ncbi:hypothetical protein HDU96_007012 [Phlyctochytrium bullatum]|nr:hypothetical protein HDU96_007012 [Phlyctochytrium bullatum]
MQLFHAMAVLAAVASVATAQSTTETPGTTPPASNASCTQVTGTGVYPITDVYACFDSFPISNELKAAETDALRRFYDVYPFGDLNVKPPEVLFQNNVNFLQELDAITANATNLFDYYSRVRLLINSMNDAHFAYTPTCINTFTFFQPFEIAAFYPASAGGRPVLRVVGNAMQFTIFQRAGGMPALWSAGLPSGATLDTFTNYTVKAIEGQDAVTYVQNYAARLAGFSRSPDTNFNYILYRRDYIDGEYSSKPGNLYATNFLGRDAKPTRTYTLVPPNGSSEVNVTFPWLGAFRFDVNIRSNEEYYQQFCVRPAQTLQRREVNTISDVFGDQPKIPQWSTGYSGPINVPAAALLPPAAVGPIGAGVSTGLRAPVDLSRPVVRDNSTAFYVLDDGTTGVWVFATTQPKNESEAAAQAWIETIFNGFYTLNKRGVKKLIIDVSGNGGGQFCTATGIAEFLLANTTMITDQIKLTNTTRTLMKLDYLGFLPTQQGPADALPLNGSDITTSPTRKDRGGGPVDLSGFFRLCQRERAEQRFASLPRLDNPWKASDLAVVSDGYCGSACGCMVRSMRDAHGIRTFTYGGVSGKAFTPTSYEGGIVVDFAAILQFNARAPIAGLSASETALLPRNFTSLITGQIPITEGYSFRGKFGQEWPAEFIPAPADVHLTGIEDVTDRTAIWRAVAAQMNGGGTATTLASTGTGATATATASTTTTRSAAGGLKAGAHAAVAVLVAGLAIAFTL